VVKPRFASTCDQSVIVVATGADEAVVTVGVALLAGVAVAVDVATGVPVTEVLVVVAPSSRKIINGFPHQCNFASATVVTLVEVLCDVGPPPKLKPEQEVSSILARSTDAPA
jgi:hypothetical protein